MFEQLDFGIFHGASKAERDEFCRRLVSELRHYGFVKLINHGVPLEDVNKAFETSRNFFQLPLSEKLKSPHPPTANPHRGFSPIGLENISTISNYGSASTMPLLKDMKESYDIGSDNDPIYKNIWPPAGLYDSFQTNFTSFFASCYEVELVILDAISIGLGLPTQTLRLLHQTQANELRLTHYPSVSRDAFVDSTRIAAHTDFGTITLLFQDNVGGLEMESPPNSGKFIPINSGGQGECILNVGDCLEMWTGLRSARHRVHLPDPSIHPKGSDDAIMERFSIAYFAKPDRTAILRPLQQTVEYGQQYLTANEFQHMRIQGTYA
ncbi:hypothetical protein BGW36DRAFT_390590 [Talaromyces proteolyticus]|uniref:Fe2OG dioxygenase domain-containing protein n=1 Tax=Talaromyces proteolyticus TaxID=1131652 RepID=A0AAD4KKL2_9EURO|nr:uncharacterized protein BGW36DRAFT_390590 [Talaromyces proteolyticus]KAH8690319.1 hypothetical protein BGW36DRAFT_390590 [Talaromyces proteolyticus]